MLESRVKCKAMSLWPADYNRLYEYRCPADITAVLEASDALAAAAPPPRAPSLGAGCDTCSSGEYRRVGVTSGSTANALSALNSSRMVNAILSAKAGAAFGAPRARVRSVAEEMRAKNAPPEFVPSMVMRRA